MFYIGRMWSKTPSVRLGATVGRALDQRARNEGVSKVNTGCRAWRADGVTPDAEPGKTGYDVLEGLVGKSRSGSKDLSTNPRHLAGYGR